GGGLVKAAMVVIAGLVIVALIGGGTLVMLARARNDRDALRDYEAREKATATATTSAGAALPIAAPLPSATSEGSAARPLASNKGPVALRASASASATASASPSIAAGAVSPPPTSGKRYGGTSAYKSGGSFGDCPECGWEAWYAALDQMRPQISACYKASEFEPPHHEYTEYVVHVNADGKFGAIDVAGDKTPNLDACLMGLIRGIPLVKRGGGPGKFQVGFTGECKTFECK
ncbi:MAG TPA: hypothetical protein VF316_05670, partial [Polyangiaceae bacterium]